MDRHVLYHWLHLGLDKKAIITIQEARIGTFLAVQWLRLRASTAEGTVQSLVVELLAREGAVCGSVGDVTVAWLASAPLWPSLWT